MSSKFFKDHKHTIEGFYYNEHLASGMEGKGLLFCDCVIEGSIKLKGCMLHNCRIRTSHQLIKKQFINCHLINCIIECDDVERVESGSVTEDDDKECRDKKDKDHEKTKEKEN